MTGKPLQIAVDRVADTTSNPGTGFSRATNQHQRVERSLDTVSVPVTGVAPVSAEHLFERPHQRRPLFELGRGDRLGGGHHGGEFGVGE